jgi:N-acetylneuraminate synthase
MSPQEVMKLIEQAQPFIIAEMSANHNQSLEKALQIVNAAAKAGVNALKLQTYTPDTLTIDRADGEFFIHDSKSLWQGESLYNLYKKAYMPWEWHEPIFKRCREQGIVPFSTAFDATSVELLEALGVELYKIASFEIVDIPLIQKVARTGKPILLSTGMATVAEIHEAVCAIRETGNAHVVLLKCTSTYPSSPENSHLRTLPHMRQLFDCPVGISDHTLGIGVAVAAVALGAQVIEKHFTLSRSEGGVDAPFSLEPHEMQALVEETRRAWQALGRVHYGPSRAEEDSLVFRRSLYAVQDIAEGEEFTEKNVRSIRPGHGLAPKYLKILLGRRARRAIQRGEPITWEMF